MDIEKYIHESNLIEGINNPEYDKQSMVAWGGLSTIVRRDLTVSDILSTQKIITLLQDDLLPHQRGYTRSMSKVNVYIGDSVAPSWWLVDDMLNNWLLDMKENWQNLDPIEMHIRFEHIHPFADGNGRTGRMLLWHHQIRQGKTPTLFTNAKKYDEYYPLFQKKKSKDKYVPYDLRPKAVAKSTNVPQPITLESITYALRKFKYENTDRVSCIKVARDVYEKLDQFFVEEQKKLEMEGIKTLPPDQIKLETIYGIEIIIDGRMRPGTWRVVKE